MSATATPTRPRTPLSLAAKRDGNGNYVNPSLRRVIRQISGTVPIVPVAVFQSFSK